MQEDSKPYHYHITNVHLCFPSLKFQIMCSLSNVNVNMTKAFIFRFKHISFYLQSEVFLFAGSLHVSSLHDGPVLHAGCRWPRVPHVARVSVYSHSHTRLADWLAGPCLAPAQLMSCPSLSSLSHVITGHHGLLTWLPRGWSVLG